MAGCAAPTDAERLAVALAAPTFAEARAGCEDLADPGPCLVAASERHAAGRADCDAVADPLWRDECVFRYAERAAKAGERDAAVAACEATRFGRECTFHLIREGARAVLREDVATATAAIDPWRAVRLAPDAPRLFWKTWFRERLAAKIPVDPTPCADEDCRGGARDAVYTTMAAVARATEGFCEAPTPTGTLGDRTLWVDGELTRAWVAEWVRSECLRRDRGAGP
ncbi:MAG: hypothetical protein ACOZNI_31430 [Myxococcota bacterium]